MREPQPTPAEPRPASGPDASGGDPPKSGKRKGSLFGPGLIIAASFIGPGTITTSIVTGASYGFALAWAIVFSIVATIVLQEMASRLGLGGRIGLGEAMRRTFANPVAKILMVILVVSAIGIGGAAYAGGDTTGTALAVSSVLPIPVWIIVVAIILAIAGLLISGSYKVVEKVLMVMVVILALLFIATTFVVQPPFLEALKGMFVPSIPAGAALTAIALIGTTVVPYNVFLHASLVQENWGDMEENKAIREARIDTVSSIAIGGMITLAVMATAFGGMFVHGISAETGTDLAKALEPLLGDAAGWVFAIGLFCAGFTSALAGPLGAAYAICGVLGLSTDMKSWSFRLVWILVLAVGAIIALTGFEPVSIIIIAQAANGLLLPIIAIFLLITMNNKELLGKHANGIVSNVVGVLITLVVIGLAVYQLGGLIGLW
ncbi:NRAMP (natural resistance-associated macrophage protein)-like metal ion transporter [Brachybacterium muris]|uniref:Nramp family divalent metal transporter n=1 Tax=Brachybacterium muris TaxID=219301 RepID=UPI00195A7469|nr:Nramp family divalent metal transporter [Brachybacterium muris]MBM7501442.1 NRAMP (natural resistance-associated macrophage protein)-like metal ion transporter [Brachybacterium muris]